MPMELRTMPIQGCEGGAAVTYERYRCPQCDKVWWSQSGVPQMMTILWPTCPDCPDCGVECVKEATE